MRRYFVASLVFSWVLSFGLIASPASVDGTIGSQEEKIQEVLEVSGALTQIKEIPAVFQSNMKRYKKGFSPSEFEKMETFGQQVFSYDRFYGEAVSVFRERYHDKYINRTIDWYQKPIAKRVVEQENYSASVQGHFAMLDFRKDFEKSKPDVKRLKLIVALDQTLGVSQLMLDMQVSMFRSFGRLIFRKQGLDHPDVINEKVENMVTQMSTHLRPKVKAQAILTLAFIYRDFKESEIKQVLRHYRSDAGTWFTQTSNEAFKRQITNASNEFATFVFDKPKFLMEGDE